MFTDGFHIRGAWIVIPLIVEYLPYGKTMMQIIFIVRLSVTPVDKISLNEVGCAIPAPRALHISICSTKPVEFEVS